MDDELVPNPIEKGRNKRIGSDRIGSAEAVYSPHRRAFVVTRALVPLVMAVSVLGTVAFVAMAWYGSATNAMMALQGRGLRADKLAVNLGTIELGHPVDALFTLRNITSSPITIVGATSTCTCAVPGLVTPTTIGSGASREIRVRMSATAGHGDFAQGVRIYTDQKHQPQLVLRILGTLRTVEAEPELHAIGAVR